MTHAPVLALGENRLAGMGVDTSAASTRVGDTTRALAAMRSRRRMIYKKINVPL